VAVDELVAEGISGLDLPLGRRVELSRGRTTFVREVAGPTPDAPVVVLLHGWFASGGLNWYQAFGPLSEHFRVIAPDLRGHGRGVRAWRRFRLEDCADDTAELLDHLGIERAIVCGYSMGGPVAQLVWRRHPERVEGLVFAATAASFVPGLQQRVVFAGAMAAAAGGTRGGQLLTRIPTLGRQLPGMPNKGRPTSMQRWAAQEFRRHDMRMVLEAGNSIGWYSSRKWISEVDVPTTVLVTTRDRAVNPTEQLRLALEIPGAQIQRYDAAHSSPVLWSFGAAITEACRGVDERC
jgi:3-oxoadipate enol-lactonase